MDGFVAAQQDRNLPGPLSLGYYDGSDLPYYQQDVAQAKQLLKDAGYADGLKIPVFKIVAANQLDVQLAQLMKEQWAAAGVDVTLNPMEVGAIIKDWLEGNYSMVMVGGAWVADQPQPSRVGPPDVFGGGGQVEQPEFRWHRPGPELRGRWSPGCLSCGSSSLHP